jgi:hypothetical protein
MSYDEKISALKAALEKHGLPAPWASKIMDAMAECGMTPGAVHAVSNQEALALAKAEANARGIQQIQARCAADLARIQVELPKVGYKLSPYAISAAAKAAGWHTSKILELKASLARAGWML